MINLFSYLCINESQLPPTHNTWHLPWTSFRKAKILVCVLSQQLLQVLHIKLSTTTTHISIRWIITKLPLISEKEPTMRLAWHTDSYTQRHLLSVQALPHTSTPPYLDTHYLYVMYDSAIRRGEADTLLSSTLADNRGGLKGTQCNLD